MVYQSESHERPQTLGILTETMSKAAYYPFFFYSFLYLFPPAARSPPASPSPSASLSVSSPCITLSDSEDDNSTPRAPQTPLSTPSQTIKKEDKKTSEPRRDPPHTPSSSKFSSYRHRIDLRSASCVEAGLRSVLHPVSSVTRLRLRQADHNDQNLTVHISMHQV